MKAREKLLEFNKITLMFLMAKNYINSNEIIEIEICK